MIDDNVDKLLNNDIVELAGEVEYASEVVMAKQKKEVVIGI